MVISIDHMHFELVDNYRDAFNEEQFLEKYSDVLNKYDYVVGDIGYEKLRLSGFFRDNKPKVERDKKFSAIQDYINEYCNFGCAYFVLRKLTKDEVKDLKRSEPTESISPTNHHEIRNSDDNEETSVTASNSEQPSVNKARTLSHFQRNH